MSFQRNEIQNLYNALEMRDQDIAELKGQLESALRASHNDHFIEQIEILRHENMSYREIIVSLQTQLKDSSNLDRNVQKEINYLRENSKSQDQLLQSQLNALQEKDSELDLMKEDHRRLIGEQYSLEMENQRLRDVILEMEKNETEFVREVEHLSNQNIIIDTHWREIEDERDRIQTLFEHANIKCLNYHRENNLLLEKLRCVQNKASESQEEMKSIIASHTAEITKLKCELENKERGKINADQDEKCEDLRMDLEIAESQLISAHTENRRLQKDLERTFQELNQVKDDCEESYKSVIKSERERAQSAFEQLDAAVRTQQQLRQDCEDLKFKVSELQSELEASERRNAFYESENGLNEFVSSYKVLESKSKNLAGNVKSLVNANNEKDYQIALLIKRVQHLQEHLGSKVDLPSDEEFAEMIKIEKSGLDGQIKELETQLRTLEEERNILLKRLREYSGFIGLDKELLRDLSSSQVATVMNFINNLKSDKDEPPQNETTSEMTVEISNPRAQNNLDQVKIECLQCEEEDIQLQRSSGESSVANYIEKIRSISDSFYQQNSQDSHKNVYSAQKSDQATSPQNILYLSVSDDDAAESLREDNSEKHLTEYKNSHLDIETSISRCDKAIDTYRPFTSSVSIQVSSIDDANLQVQTELASTQASLWDCEKKLAKSESMIRRLKRSLDRYDQSRNTDSNLLLAQIAMKELHELVESKTQRLEKYRSQTKSSDQDTIIPLNCEDLVKNIKKDCLLENENIIEQLRASITHSESQIRSLQYKLKDAADTISRLRYENRSYAQQIEQAESHILLKDTETQDLQTKLRVSNQRIIYLEQSIRNAKTSLHEKTIEISTFEKAESELAVLKTSLYKLRRSNEKALKNLQSANERETESQNKISELEKEAETLKLDIAVLRNANRNLTQKLKDASTNIKELKNRTQTDPSENLEVEQLKQKIIRLKKDNAKVRGELSAFKLKGSYDPMKVISNDTRKGDSKNDDILTDSLKEENIKLRQRLSSVKESAQNEYQTTIDSLKSQVSSFNGQY